MTRDSSRCADPEVLAAFAAGNLSGEELEMTVEHLRECPDCRRIVGEAARYERDESRPKRAFPWWLAAAAAALGGIALLAAWWLRTPGTDDPRSALVAATPRTARDLEPRLVGGFPWAPLRTVRRNSENALDPEQMKLIGVAGEVLQRTAGDSSVEGRHTAAQAQLLAGRPREAAATLGTLATSPSRDANLWSDLAAARYAAAVQLDDASLLASALAAADTAIRIDPQFEEALFNRALVIEKLGLREQARAAWKAYLAVDSKSEWAREAEKHLQALRDAAAFRDELERNYPRLVRDHEAARALVHRFPQESRVWGESEILNRWARSFLAGDIRSADEHLRLARALGDELVAANGEGLLQAAVRSIDQAEPATLKTLANAHVQFRDAQKTFQDRGPKPAEPKFLAAAAEFDSGRSPMALVSRYFAANTAFEQTRVDEARISLEKILTESNPRFIAHEAQVKWELGMAYAASGRWGQSIKTLLSSMSTFERLGEKNYTMVVRLILAEVYVQIGEHREAWKQRLAALQELGRTENARLQTVVHGIARGAAQRGEWSVALSFLNLQMAMPRIPGDQLMYVETLLSRARAAGHLGLSAEAMNDLVKVPAEMRGIEDAGWRERAEAERLSVRGFLASSPSSAVTLVSQAIDFHRANGRRMFLPAFFLQRGRALVSLGRHDEAASDFEEGIRELEHQRMAISSDQRWGMFGAADTLFDEAVSLALQRDDHARAFSYSDRARARELLDAPESTALTQAQPRAMVSPPHPQPAIRDRELVVEYLVLPERLVIFIVSATGIRAVQSDVKSSIIAGEVEELTRTAMTGNRKEFVRLASRMYQRLLAPLGSVLANNETLVVVPDATLSVVPFAALIDPGGRYVVERHAVVVTPSVAAYARLRQRRTPPAKPARLLLIAGPEKREGDSGRLSAQQDEMDGVAAEYTGSITYAANDIDHQVLQQRARTADVIHFVGHAVMPDGNQKGALVTSRRMDLDEQLDVRKIAGMRLRRPALVVLAACGTARAHGRTGDASVSLARAFLAAGVPRVAATLWPIDDRAAAEFFPRLHHYLARGMSPAEALRAAQLEWVHRPDAPPGVWASVQIIGS